MITSPSSSSNSSSSSSAEIRASSLGTHWICNNVFPTSKGLAMAVPANCKNAAPNKVLKKILKSTLSSLGGYSGERSKTEGLEGRVDHECSAKSVELVVLEDEGTNSQVSVGAVYRSLSDAGRFGVNADDSESIAGADGDGGSLLSRRGRDSSVCR